MNETVFRHKEKKKDLEETGWRRMECGHWEDPLTGNHETTTHAWDISHQRIGWK